MLVLAIFSTCSEGPTFVSLAIEDGSKTSTQTRAQQVFELGPDGQVVWKVPSGPQKAGNYALQSAYVPVIIPSSQSDQYTRQANLLPHEISLHAEAWHPVKRSYL